MINPCHFRLPGQPLVLASEGLHYMSLDEAVWKAAKQPFTNKYQPSLAARDNLRKKQSKDAPTNVVIMTTAKSYSAMCHSKLMVGLCVSGVVITRSYCMYEADADADADAVLGKGASPDEAPGPGAS